MTEEQLEVLTKAGARKAAHKIKQKIISDPRMRELVFTRCRNLSDIEKMVAEMIAYTLSGSINTAYHQNSMFKLFVAEVASDLMAEMGDAISEQPADRLEQDHRTQRINAIVHREFPIIIDQDPKFYRDLVAGFFERLSYVSEQLESNPGNFFTRRRDR